MSAAAVHLCPWCRARLQHQAHCWSRDGEGKGGLWLPFPGEGKVGDAAVEYVHPVLCGTVGLTPWETWAHPCQEWELVQLPSSCPASRLWEVCA